MDVFDLVAKISLDSGPFEKGIDKAKSKMSQFGDLFKANIASDVVSKGFSAITSGVTKAVGGLKTLVSESQSAFGNYQQMVGGVQKLYGNMGMSLEDYAKSVGKSTSDVKDEWEALGKAQDTVLKNAKNAYKTAGMSANTYMETATQFSASLINSLGGDTQKAAKQTDIAMQAISDNFNTFGGNMEDVTNAFKGFSKQNYTMLDNLKLGYGGTKTEMERLIKDANEWGKANGEASNLSINSFSDVVTAIEQIQEKQHIAGTTAREASTTLEGSMGQMQAAWENLKTSIGSGEDLKKNISNLVDTIIGYTDKSGEHVKGYLDNLLPVISQALDGIGTLIEKAAPIISERLPDAINSLLPALLTSAGTLISSFVSALPELLSSIKETLSTSLGDIIDPEAMSEKAGEIVGSLSTTLSSMTSDLITIGAQILTALIQGITENADTILNGAMEIITALGEGIITNLPLLVDAVVQLLQSFTQYITEHKDEIQTGVQALIDAIVQGIITLTPDLTEAALAIVTTLGGALIGAVPDIVEQLPTFISELFGAITEAWNGASGEEKVALAGVLLPIFTGGIKSAIDGIGTAKDIAGAGKDIFSKIFKTGDKGAKVFDEGADFLGLGQDWTEALPDADKVSTLDKLKEALGGVKDGLAGIGGKALDGLKTLGTTIGSIATTIGSGFLTGIQTVGTFITGTILPGIGGLMTTLAPFLPMILGITAAIVAIIVVIKNWDKISKALQKGWEALKGAAGNIWGGIKDAVTGAWKGIKSGVKSGAEKVKKTVGGAWDKIKNSTSEKWGAIKGEVEKNGGGIKGVLKTAVKGYLSPWKKGFDALNKATDGKLGKTVKSVKKKAKEILNGIKEKFKGAADIGKNLVKGLWGGINDKVSWIIKKVKGFGKKVLNGLKDFFGIHSPSKVMEDQIGKNLALGVAKGIDKHSKKAKKSASEMGQAILDAASKKLEHYETYHTLSLANEVTYWNKIRKTIKKGTDARYEADKNYLEKKKQLKEQEKQADADLKSALQTAEDNYQQSIQATIDKISQRKDSIMSAFSLFGSFDAGEGVGKSTLITGLQSQVDALENWSAQMDELKGRLGDTDLFKAVQEMGVSSLNDVIALNSMTDEELSAYNANYDKLNKEAENRAQNELAPETQKESEQALKDYVKEVNSAWSTYTSTMDDMGVKVKKVSKSVTASFKNVGKTYSEALDSMNLDSQTKVSTLTDTLEGGFKKMSKKTKKYGKDLVQNFIDGIASKESDLSDAVVKKIAKQVKKYVGFSEPEAGPLSDFHKYAPDMIDLFVSGIEKNGQKIGQAFDDSLALTDLSSRISDGMFAPAVQAAGNSLSIAGLPNLTEISTAGQQSSQTMPQQLNITMQVDKTAFAKIIYQLNNLESQRVGVSLASGMA